ncbi:MAG: hypothetical protein A2486_06800 [Burkholderiales bacterium RIFOXYC12_FULL_65_23]|nr:MAG: hypothetical protein A2486_06800 [Burkholderiales bacterium RIFOXYC12_FULL_65_23]
MQIIQSQCGFGVPENYLTVYFQKNLRFAADIIQSLLRQPCSFGYTLLCAFLFGFSFFWAGRR